jgi:hypothetical protein
VRASLSPGCFSGTCTQVLSKTGAVTLDAERQRIEVSDRFVLRNLDFPRGSQACSRDCGGASTVEADLTGLAPGVYSVELGGRPIGQLAVPLAGQVCFDDRAPFPTPITATPAPGAVAPTATATVSSLPYPAPQDLAPAATSTASSAYP